MSADQAEVLKLTNNSGEPHVVRRKYAVDFISINFHCLNPQLVVVSLITTALLSHLKFCSRAASEILNARI